MANDKWLQLRRVLEQEIVRNLRVSGMETDPVRLDTNDVYIRLPGSDIVNQRHMKSEYR